MHVYYIVRMELHPFVEAQLTALSAGMMVHVPLTQIAILFVRSSLQKWHNYKQIELGVRCNIIVIHGIICSTAS